MSAYPIVMPKRSEKEPSPEHPESPWRDVLQKLRTKHNLSQADAAKLLGVPVRTWISWENKHRMPSRLAKTALRAIWPKDISAKL